MPLPRKRQSTTAKITGKIIALIDAFRQRTGCGVIVRQTVYREGKRVTLRVALGGSYKDGSQRSYSQFPEACKALRGMTIDKSTLAMISA